MEFLTTPDLSATRAWASATAPSSAAHNTHNTRHNATPSAKPPPAASPSSAAPHALANPSPAGRQEVAADLAKQHGAARPPTANSPPKGAVKLDDGKLVAEPRADLPHSAAPASHPLPSPPSAAFPHIPGSTTFTPRASHAAYAPLDRAGIKNSFQSLFSPGPGATPHHHAHALPTPGLATARTPGAAQQPMGLTPFLNGVQTPSLVPSSAHMVPHFTPHHPVPQHHAQHHARASPPSATHPGASEIFMSSPYLQAAAKEAVRREFMNMPSYVTPGASASPQGDAEHVVPGATSPAAVPATGASTSPPDAQQQQQHHHHHHHHHQQAAHAPTHSPATAHPAPAAASTTSPHAKVPSQNEAAARSSHTAGSSSTTNPVSSVSAQRTDKVGVAGGGADIGGGGSGAAAAGDNADAKVPKTEASSSSAAADAAAAAAAAQPAAAAAAAAAYGYPRPMAMPQAGQMHPFFIQHPSGHPGMVLVGSHPHMMIPQPGAHPAQAMYGAPPGMVMFPGAGAGGAPVVMSQAQAQAHAAHALAQQQQQHQQQPQQAHVQHAPQAQPAQQAAHPQHMQQPQHPQPAQHVPQQQAPPHVPHAAPPQHPQAGAAAVPQPGSASAAGPGPQQHETESRGGGEGSTVTGANSQASAVVKQESQLDKKSRMEHEKQELIREFKKKTREAALVRFRQKRRERRFGKLIRYDCRKKLADARPRVKGRFVRIKADDGEDDSEGMQVVPDAPDA